MAARRMSLAVVAGLCLALPAAAGQRVQPMPRASLPALTSGEAKVLRAWVVLCERMPDECKVDTDEPRTVVLDPATWGKVLAVNVRLNHAIKAVTDIDHWGIEDRWDFAEDGRGDCEDYALAKRRALAAAGIPRRALRMTVVFNEFGEGHAVLTLLTDRGDLVLDNRSDEVLPWGRTGYRFVKRESQDKAGWVYLGTEGSPDLTASRRPR